MVLAVEKQLEANFADLHTNNGSIFEGLQFPLNLPN
jgi:hypothetical protein